MPEPLDAVKERLKKRYLGKHGVHGIGISQSQNAVRLYVDPQFPIRPSPLLEEITREASPYKVIVVEEDRPLIR